MITGKTKHGGLGRNGLGAREESGSPFKTPNSRGRISEF